MRLRAGLNATLNQIRARLQKEFGCCSSTQLLFSRIDGRELEACETLWEACEELQKSCTLVDTGGLRRGQLVGVTVRSWWEDDEAPGGGTWYTAKVTEFKNWAAGVYPGEGYMGPGFYFEIKYLETGEFEYIPEPNLWKVVEPTFVAGEEGMGYNASLYQDQVQVQAQPSPPGRQREDLLELGNSLWANGAWS